MSVSVIIKSTTTSLNTLFWLRCLAVVGQTITILVVHILLAMPLPLVPMFSTIMGLAIVNTYTYQCLQQAKHGRTISEPFLAVQLMIDIMSLAVLLYFSGGAFNPFVSLFLLPLAIAAAILSIGYTVSLVALTIFLYASLMTDSVPLPPAPDELENTLSLHIFGMWINFMISASLMTGFVSYLSSKIRDSDYQLARTRENHLRQEQILALGTLAAGTAHELGTPLSTIAVLAAELEQQLPSQTSHEIREDFILLRQQVQQCKHILGTMLQKVELAQSQRFNVLSASQLVQNVVEKFQLLRPMVSIKVPSHLHDAAPLLAGDATLEQALLNLLNNAADASAEYVEIHLNYNQQNIVIDICDKGLGFPQEVLNVRGTAFISTKGEEGMGIGLFLANATLERLGGDVVFLPREGGGVIARVILPIYQQTEC